MSVRAVRGVVSGPAGPHRPVAERAAICLRSQPEGEAPLGWTIDDTTAGALESQLLSNKDGLYEIQGWFPNPHPCSG